MIARGGKAVYGAELGILMLEARFPRIPGDMGNALTWPFPVRYKVVRGASPQRVVLEGAPGLLEPFIDAARELVAEGCEGITTNCGFLSIFQRELAEAVGVPVATSSLMQAALAAATSPPGRPPAILTISAGTLTPAHLAAAGVPEGAPVGGVARGAFTSAILGDAPEMDVAAARAEMIAAAEDLVAAHPETGAIILECTNMTPYAADIARATGRRVHSVHDFICWFQSGLRPRRFPDPD